MMDKNFMEKIQYYWDKRSVYWEQFGAVPWTKIVFAGISAYLILRFLTVAFPVVIYLLLALTIWRMIKNIR